MGGFLQIILSVVFVLMSATADTAQGGQPVSAFLTKEEASRFVEPPYSLGETIGDGSWTLINLDGRVAGYGFESAPLAPLPGFSGAPIDMFVMITVEGRFIDVKLVRHNEPIFVSGLGEAPLRNFLTQYKGRSITDALVVGVPYGGKDAGTSLVYLDGVTKATASVRIAHESILGAAQAIAREKMAGMGAAASSRPDPDHWETLTWDDLVKQGLVTRKTVTNAEMQKSFEGTKFFHDDPEASESPDKPFLDLWLADIGPPSIARAVLKKDTLAQLERFLAINPDSEPILVLDAGRHGLITEDFVRNTSPDLLSAKQGGLPVALRDADLTIELNDSVPKGASLILRTDRRLGFNPAAEWEFTVRALRKHGSFQPEIGSTDLTTAIRSDSRFFIIAEQARPDPIWLQMGH
jgi:NosR/NirI family transcriptional regulator, nitrous oxide reductase regulator